MLNILKYYALSEDQSADFGLIKSYFQSKRFKIRKKGNAITCTKGNLVYNHLTMNPIRWKSEHLVRVVNNEIEIRSKIDTTGQAVTAAEIAVWHEFLDGISDVLLQRELNYDRLREARKENKLNNLMFIGFLILGMIFIGIIVFLLASNEVINEALIEPLLTFGTISGFFAYGWWRSRRDIKRFDKKSRR
ncbi:MAG: hypothetical protein AAGJ93_03600 [Bacteroidota bacterium]